MPIEKINTQIVGLPPSWMSRMVSRGGTAANTPEIKKILGEPIPQLVDPKTLPPEIAAFFGPRGLLERLRRKLAMFSRKKGGRFLPAKNTIASVDEDDNVYVGVDFLADQGDNEALVAGILAHEWGHMMSDLPKGIDWSKLTWDQLHALRRDEEGDADGFAGRALFLMGYTPEQMIEFLKQNDKRRKEKKLPCHKYHNHATRVAILTESFEAQKKSMEVARRLFFSGKDTTGPKVGRILSVG